MKILYYGGQKSGKSLLAEQKALILAKETKPYYIATYDNSYQDKEMQKRLHTHQSQRKDTFITIEEPKDLVKVIKAPQCYLIDCMSMWILNTLEQSQESILEQIEALFCIDATIVFVLNDVNSGIIPIDKESRAFVDRSGIVGQRLAKLCDAVYEVKLGLEVKLK